MDYDINYWNEYYTLNENEIPWTTKFPDHNLTSLDLSSFNTALDIGCGDGVNSIYMSEQGLQVTGIDISENAINRCKSKYKRHTATFMQLNFLDQPLNETYDLIYDRGVFHVFDTHEERIKFVKAVKECMHESSIWVSLIGSTASVHTQNRPPKRSLYEIVYSIDSYLHILSVNTTTIDTNVHNITDKIKIENEKLSAFIVVSKLRI